MVDATTEFFEGLRGRHEHFLETTSGTLRFEIRNGKRTERWFVSIDKGDIDVSHKNARADCTLRSSKNVFDGIATGAVNPLAALLRGQIFAEGNTRVLVRFQRLFPAPPPRPSARSRKAKR
jgi:putative sterol carrier protein